MGLEQAINCIYIWSGVWIFLDHLDAAWLAPYHLPARPDCVVCAILFKSNNRSYNAVPPTLTVSSQVHRRTSPHTTISTGRNFAPKAHCLRCTKWIKCTLAQALRLCAGRTAHSGSRGIALLFLDLDTRRGWGVNVTPRPLFTPGKDPVPIVQEAGWAPGPVWTGAENLAPTGIRSPDRPASSQSLYRLSYPAHLLCRPTNTSH